MIMTLSIQVSMRSRSSDCYCSAKSSMESTPTLPRRSSSSSATGVTRLFSSNNRASKLRAERVSSTGSDVTTPSIKYNRNPHRSLERLGGKGRALYVGSHSTSSLPRRVNDGGSRKSSKEDSLSRRSSTEESGSRRSSKEETGSRRSSKEETGSRRSSKEEAGSRRSSKEESGSRKSSKEETGTRRSSTLEKKGEQMGGGGGPLFSFLGGGGSSSDRRRQSMLKGESTESLDKREERRVRRQSPSPLPKHKQVTPITGPAKEVKKVAAPTVAKKPTGSGAGSGSGPKVEDGTGGGAGTARRVVRPSSTAPVRAATLPRGSRIASSSATAPILRRPLSQVIIVILILITINFSLFLPLMILFQAASSPGTSRKAVIATDARNKTTIKITKSLPATKKVSFEYSGGGEVRVQEGLAMDDYNNLPALPLKKQVLNHQDRINTHFTAGAKVRNTAAVDNIINFTFNFRPFLVWDGATSTVEVT